MSHARTSRNAYENKRENATPKSETDDGKAYETNGESMISRFAEYRMRIPSKTLMNTDVKMKHRKVKNPDVKKAYETNRNQCF